MSDQIAKTRSEAELKSAITAFEQILDAEPNDRLALETLAESYGKLGDSDRTNMYVRRLFGVIVADGDAEAAKELLGRFKSASEAPENAEFTKQMRELMRKSGTALAPSLAAKTLTHDITREVSLAWDLLQAEEISQDDYALVVQDLSENSNKVIDVPVTVLHALQDRSFKTLDRVLAFISRTGGKPLVSLSHYEIQLPVVGLLPNEFLTHRGAIAFETIGRDALVAVLNPFDIELQEDVRRITNRRCHFYLTSAAEYDNMLANIRKMRESNS